MPGRGGKDGGRFRTVYVSDLLDVLAGRETRSFFGGDEAAGVPVPIDVWGLHQAGLGDEQLRKLPGESGPGDPDGALTWPPARERYENARAFFVAQAAALNAAAAGGVSSWLPQEAEAVGRFELQRRLELDRLTADEIFEEADLDG